MQEYCPHCMAKLPDGAETCPKCKKSTDVENDSVCLAVGSILSGNGKEYLIGKTIGEGGFGMTYTALDLENKRKVAIKEYLPKVCLISRNDGTVVPGSQQAVYDRGLKSFFGEASMLYTLEELPSMVKVYDFFKANGTAYIIMEYLDGTTLYNHVTKNGVMTFEELLPKLKRLMEDLGKLHSAGVIHRDIAPDNIMLMPDGSLKLFDFGSARSLFSGTHMTSVLKQSCAPIEQYGSKGQGPHTDIYALCATVYFCLTGQFPKSSVDRVQALTDKQPDPLEPPSKLGANIDPKNEKVLLWGLAPYAANRPKNIAELMSGFEKEKKRSKSMIIPAVVAVVLLTVILAFTAGIMLGNRGRGAPVTPTTAGEPTPPEKVSSKNEIHFMKSSSRDKSPLKSFSEVKNVTFKGSLEGAPANAKDISATGDRSVLAWLGGTEAIIATDGKIAIVDASYLFQDFTKLRSIDFGDCFDTSETTSMSHMFYNCKNLESLDLSGFDTSSVTDLQYAFNYCTSIKRLDLSNFDTSNVTDMRHMFDTCESLETLDISNFDTSKVTDMGYMFGQCPSLTQLNLSSFNTSNVTTMYYMFGYCSSLKKLKLSNFDTSKVTNFCHMFDHCENLTVLNLDNFDTSKITDMSYMFESCKSLVTLDLSNFDTSKVIAMGHMFESCESLEAIDLTSFNNHSRDSIYSMFNGCKNLKTIYCSSKLKLSDDADIPEQTEIILR